MKTIIKLVLAALIVNITWRAGNVYLRYYRFTDAIHEAALFSAQKSEGELRVRVAELARQLDVPVQQDDIHVRHSEYRIIVDTAYTDKIEYVPGKFYPWKFKVNVDTLVSTPEMR
jgi:hypothetical protein